MYSRCLFCAHDLGKNDVVEHFPVGQRLAFDAAKGRLWVVCPRCERWNLTPIEERWEAIEECERLYRGTVVRASTDNVGIAYLRDGTRLIRVGKPLRPEFAAWRYGDQFGRRRRRAIWLGAGGATAAGGLVALAAGAAATVGPLAFAPLLAGAWSLGMFAMFRGHSIGAAPRGMRIRTLEGHTLDPAENAIVNVEMRDDGHGQLRVALDYNIQAPYTDQPQTIVEHGTVVGADARWLASRLMPRINGVGAGARRVRGAVDWVDRSGGPEGFFPAMFAETRRLGLAYSPVEAFPAELRLALEMALHEDAERRAVEGELAQLEEAWKDAEQIAAIADNLFLSRGVQQKLRALKRARGG